MYLVSQCTQHTLAKVKGLLPTGTEEDSQAANITSPGGGMGGTGKGVLWVVMALVIGSVLVVGLLLTATVLVYTAKLSRRRRLRRPQYLGNCRTLDSAHSKWM